MAQIGSFVDLFVWLLVLKSFFLPLFIIPTGSMAETLAGAHATNTCPNCGWEYMIGPVRTAVSEHMPDVIQCPNCRLLELKAEPGRKSTLRQKAGDRIMVHGWPFALGPWGQPERWDVVVFKNPNEPDVNFIKRLIALPGETVEIINGDVFITPPGADTAEIVQKTPEAQQSLWFPYYNQDYLPREPTDHDGDQRADYLPQWQPTESESNWADLRTRRPRFDGLDAGQQEVLFTTSTRGKPVPGDILDQYGYNSPRLQPHAACVTVSDVRLGTDVTIEEGSGTFDLILERFEHRFVARLSQGQLTLLHARGNATPAPVGERVAVDTGQTLRLAIAHADGVVTVSVNDEPVLSSQGHYTITPEVARQQERPRRSPVLRMAAANVRLQLERIRIDRDVHYRRANIVEKRRPGNGVSGNPLRIPDDAYYVLGDNSPASQDSRLWHEDMLGPHLIDPYRAGEYTLGTVPGRDMIGKAFLVYWPGFLPLTPNGPNIVLDFGRVRWIN